MDTPERKALATLPVVVLVGIGMALAGSHGGVEAGGVPVFALATATAFVIQWLAFVPAYLLRSERFFDLTGGFTYLVAATMGTLLNPHAGSRAVLLLAMVGVWAVRLAGFLFARVHRAGTDARFDELKQSFTRYLLVWTMQGLWVTLTLAAALAAITSPVRVPLGWPAYAGAVIWGVGFIIEFVADLQKSRFRSREANRGQFIRSGLWAWSRHPNYFGEIVLWIGVAFIALPVLRGWQYVTLISPVFVVVLLNRISGVPILEQRADERWGGQADYEAYKARTPVLIPRPPRNACT